MLWEVAIHDVNLTPSFSDSIKKKQRNVPYPDTFWILAVIVFTYRTGKESTFHAMFNDDFAFRIINRHLLLMLHSVMILLSRSKDFPTFAARWTLLGFDSRQGTVIHRRRSGFVVIGRMKEFRQT